MKLILDHHPELFGDWMMNILDGGKWLPGRGVIIGLWDNRPLAACLYEAYNGASIMLHIATDGSRQWMNREYLWFVFFYAFEQQKACKILAPVESSNSRCLKFIEHIGFVLEATLKDAAPDGDLLIYTMRKDQCKWLTLRNSYRGQTHLSLAG